MFDDRELNTLNLIFEGWNNCYMYVLRENNEISDGVFFDATAENIATFIYNYKDEVDGLLITDTIDREMMRVKFEPDNTQHPVQISYGERWQIRPDLQKEIIEHFNAIYSGKEKTRTFPVVPKSVYETYCDITEREAVYAEYYGER